VQNPIVVSALNPLIGYSQGAEMVKEAAERRLTIIIFASAIDVPMPD
jgi:fumarate hydratase class II